MELNTSDLPFSKRTDSAAEMVDRTSPVCFHSNINFSRWLFRIAGIYGLAVLVPQYFMEEQLGHTYPPLITHSEYFYGFLGVGMAWQVAFLLIAQDPTRYRLFIIPAILEKVPFGVAVVLPYAQHRIPTTLLGGGIVDLVLAILFLCAFWKLAVHPKT